MFNVKVLNDAIAELSEEGKAQIQLLVDTFEGYKDEVSKLEDISEGYRITAESIQKTNEHLEKTLETQAARILELTTTTSIKPKEVYNDGPVNV